MQPAVVGTFFRTASSPNIYYTTIVLSSHIKKIEQHTHGYNNVVLLCVCVHRLSANPRYPITVSTECAENALRLPSLRARCIGRSIVCR